MNDNQTTCNHVNWFMNTPRSHEAQCKDCGKVFTLYEVMHKNDALREQLTITQHTLGLTVLAAEAERIRAEKAREGLRELSDMAQTDGELSYFPMNVISRVGALLIETAPQAPTAPAGTEQEGGEG